jgi:hypothetical protein
MDSQPACIFCQIANHTQSAKIYHEDGDLVVFQDTRPVAPVHILIIPNRSKRLPTGFQHRARCRSIRQSYPSAPDRGAAVAVPLRMSRDLKQMLKLGFGIGLWLLSTIACARAFPTQAISQSPFNPPATLPSPTENPTQTSPQQVPPLPSYDADKPRNLCDPGWRYPGCNR